MKKLIQKLARKLGLEVTRYKESRHGGKTASLTPETARNGNVLLSYIIEPFCLKDGEPVSDAHTHDWESLQIAKTFLELGYAVDVIDYSDNTFIPQKKYSFFIGARTNFERIAQSINADCVKIVHLDTAHWLFNNFASYRRCLDLQRRKGVTVTTASQRIVESNLAIEYADYATLLGNSSTLKTYLYANKPIFRIPISTCAMYSSPQDKDYDTCKTNFLWFGSGGLVHKGLDLVLDAFAEMPDCHLYICGPIKDEENFEKAFYKELYGTPNIHAIGWVNIKSQEFRDILNRCAAIVYPSCCEGQSGSVINCLHAGLIPVVSYESGVDVGDFGIILKDCSIDSIKKTVEMISTLSAGKLKDMSLKAWNFARTHHSRERFAEEFRKIIDEIMHIHDTRHD